MNIFNLLTMKSQVAYLIDTMTVRDAMEQFSSHGYTAVPVINSEGVYLETVTEGDFLRYLLANDVTSAMECMNTDLLGDIAVKRDIHAVHVTAALDDLVELCKTQNFVPVVDDRETFIGIVTRKDLICYAVDKCNELKKELAAK